MIKWGVSEPTPKVPTRIICVKVKETKVGTMETPNERETIYVRDRNYNRDNNYGNINERVGPYVPRGNRESRNREAGGSMSHIEDVMQMMKKRFDVADENVKEMRNDFSRIGQKVDAHAVSIKQLEQQFIQLSTTVNPA
uniref:Integrase core domain containing protein n=1 Tax=Solanum tuberosum TaxID=4113 RepID=M1DLV6_SOLTU